MTSASNPMAIREEIAALKRVRIFDAAVGLFYENGYDKTTLEAVAERLGVTKPFIYSHFSSKADLLADICARGISASLAAMESVKALDVSPSRRLELLGNRFVTAVLDNQMYIAIFTREEKGLAPADLDKINLMRRSFDKELTALIREGVEAGEFDVTDPHMAALSIGGMVSWAYVWFRAKGRLSTKETAQEMTKLILDMVNAKPSGS
jgi:TetR/AcrR family transcriptional regulator, cholesterol catabolism regulator